jgi:MarR family transcriptional regulator, transcriptional regulator for hemolysin
VAVKTNKKRSAEELVGIRIGFLIHDVSRLRRAVMDRINPHRTITRSEIWVLTGISRRESGISQTELSRVLGMGKVATGEFVEALESKGFVQRSMDAKDRRAHCVQVTPKGWSILEKIQDVVCQMNAEVFKDFSVQNLQQFADHLRRAKWQLDSMAARMPRRAAAPARAPQRKRSRSV